MSCSCMIEGIDGTINHTEPSGRFFRYTVNKVAYEPCANHLSLYVQNIPLFIETSINCACNVVGRDGTFDHTAPSHYRYEHTSTRQEVTPCMNHYNVYSASDYYRLILDGDDLDVAIAPCPHRSHAIVCFGKFVFERISERTRFASCAEHKDHWLSLGNYRFIETVDRIEQMKSQKKQSENKSLHTWVIEGKIKRNKPTQTYVVSMNLDGDFDCTCPEWRFQDKKQDCAHILKKKLDLMKEHGTDYLPKAKKKDLPIRSVQFED